MDLVNKKIDKAKQSISQLQTEGGGLRGMGLQSPARLANSRNSSTNTLKQYASNLVNNNNAESNRLSAATLSNQNSPNKADQLFLFNNQ